MVKESIKDLPTPPSYIISDNDTKLKRAARLLEIPHIPDVGHTLALFLEKTYKKEDHFKEYMRKLSRLRVQEIMTPLAYLLPPSQRTVARFMNLRDVVKWSVRIKENLHRLGKEKQKFFFIREYASLIDELQESFSLVDQINLTLKKEGISQATLQKELKRLYSFKGRSERQRKLACHIEAYLREQVKKVPIESKRIHGSSDIIESLFSVYKRRKSPNPLHGVTTSILLLPLLTRRKQYTPRDFTQALQGVTLTDLKQWKEKNLPFNQAHKRRIKLTA